MGHRMSESMECFCDCVPIRRQDIEIRFESFTPQWILCRPFNEYFISSFLIEANSFYFVIKLSKEA